MQQKRLIYALLISTAILFVWSYFVPKPPAPVSPPTTQVTPPAAASPISAPTAAVTPAPVGSSSEVVSTTPHRVISIKTPLYEVKLDSLGAEAISWIIKKNKDSGQDIHSVAGDKKNRVPLELVSQEGLKRQPREAPLQLSLRDPSVDALLTSSNYVIDGVDSSTGDSQLTLGVGEKKRITFLLNDKATGLDVVKTIELDADSYVAGLELTIKRGGQIVPEPKLRIGPSFGDQGVKHYTFYSVAPEAVAAVGEKVEVERHQAQAINENKNSPDHLMIPGPVDWASVGDTYFSIVAIPARILQGLELQRTHYDYADNGNQERRYVIKAWVLVPSDGPR